MSIKIRKYEGGEIFDLPADYVIEAEKSNPLFEKRGSQTVPIHFPATVKNSRLLNFPFRQDKTDRQEETTEVLVETGSFQQRGLLSVHSASKQTVSANIGYDESVMYAKFKTMQLRDIPNLPVVSFGGSNVNERVDSMLVHLTAGMKQQEETDYYIFPVILKYGEVENGDTKKTYYEILNDIDTDFDTANPSTFPNGKIAGLRALSNRTVIRYGKNEEIELLAPKGYGVSPFLKVYSILELIFEHYSFRISENPFREHRQLKKFVALNNTMDAVLTGTLHYRDLMPDITVQEFLDALFSKFGMLYFVDSNSMTVRLKFIKDVVTHKNADRISLSAFKSSNPVISFSEPKQLRLKMNREIEQAKTLHDTFEEFLERFPRLFTHFDNFLFTTSTNGNEIRLKETELFPFVFIHPKYPIVFKSESGNQIAAPVKTFGTFCTMNIQKVLAKFPFGTRRIEVCPNGKYSFHFTILPGKLPEESYLLRFRNSLGAFEILEVTGKAIHTPEFSEESLYETITEYDFYEERRSRVKSKGVIEVETGYRERYEFSFIQDMIQSDEIYFIYPDGEFFRCHVTAEGAKWRHRITEPTSIKLKIRPVVEEEFSLPELDLSDNRIFSRTFSLTFN